jgi:hypothetical protein
LEKLYRRQQQNHLRKHCCQMSDIGSKPSQLIFAREIKNRITTKTRTVPTRSEVAIGIFLKTKQRPIPNENNR